MSEKSIKQPPTPPTPQVGIQRQNPPLNRTYRVTIRREAGEYVARDAAGNWRARGKVEDCDSRSPVALVVSLFHSQEVESVRTMDGVILAEILNF